jgi:hypothetical protein
MEKIEDLIISSPRQRGGTSSSYLTARIARDCAAVLEEMKKGFDNIKQTHRQGGHSM